MNTAQDPVIRQRMDFLRMGLLSRGCRSQYLRNRVRTMFPTPSYMYRSIATRPS